MFLPPGINLVIICIGLFGLKRFRRIAISLLAFGCGSLFLLSTPQVSHSLQQYLESENALTVSDLKKYQLKNQNKAQIAIVVLSAGRIYQSPEYANIDTVSEPTLSRLSYASWLHNKTNLPVLLSGGSLLNEATSEAVLMNNAMLSNFSVAPKWIESNSKNLLQSAQLSSELLKQNNIETIILVTHAKQMNNAKFSFEMMGLSVISAPMAFSNMTNQMFLYSYLPNSDSLNKSSQALNEMLKQLWFKVIY